MLKRIYIIALMLVMVVSGACYGAAASAGDNAESKDGGHEKSENLDVKGIIFEHLGDGYGWEVPFSHVYRIPLPVIVRAEDHQWFSFSSADLTDVVVTRDAETGKEHEILVPVVKTCERNGKKYQFVIAHVSTHKDKVVQIFPLNAEDQKIVAGELAKDNPGTEADEGMPVIDGYVYVDDVVTVKDGVFSTQGHYYREYKPLDISITKNVLALFIAALIVTVLVLCLVRFYARKGLQAPRKGMGFFEMLVSFIYYDTIKATLGDKTPKFAPYLLTAFFFILVMNLVGLIVIFPGGANLTGNIAITLVLAVCTFLLTNILGTKHYWKEIFWPDVPIWLKFPLPIMQLIEIFGIFTKPAALAVRLFANMMGGHMIVITLTLLIFIFASFGAAVAGGAAVVSVLFSVFMLALDVLVSFIQAYVFTLLSALFIAMAQQGEEHHDALKDKSEESKEKADLAEMERQKAVFAKEATAIDVDLKK